MIHACIDVLIDLYSTHTAMSWELGREKVSAPDPTLPEFVGMEYAHVRLSLPRTARTQIRIEKCRYQGF